MIRCRHCKQNVPRREYYAVHIDGRCTDDRDTCSDKPGDENSTQLKCPECGMERSYSKNILKNCPKCGTELEVTKEF